MDGRTPAWPTRLDLQASRSQAREDDEECNGGEQPSHATSPPSSATRPASVISTWERVTPALPQERNNAPDPQGAEHRGHPEGGEGRHQNDDEPIQPVLVASPHRRSTQGHEHGPGHHGQQRGGQVVPRTSAK